MTCPDGIFGRHRLRSTRRRATRTAALLVLRSHCWLRRRGHRTGEPGDGKSNNFVCVFEQTPIQWQQSFFGPGNNHVRFTSAMGYVNGDLLRFHAAGTTQIATWGDTRIPTGRGARPRQRSLAGPRRTQLRAGHAGHHG